MNPLVPLPRNRVRCPSCRCNPNSIRVARLSRIMVRVLITGMSGSGKTTLLDALSSRGHHSVDTDYDGWTLETGLWDELRMRSLLGAHKNIVISGTVENQARFHDFFEHVVLLSAPIDVLLERVRWRDNNTYGQTPDQQDEIRAYVRDVEPLLRQGATLELDACQPVSALVDAVDLLLRR